MQATSERLLGLDLARFLAFAGMVIVNFSVVMGATPGPDGWANILSSSLEGRAAASFVVLAGIGLGLAAERTGFTSTRLATMKRAAFLLVVGLLNMLIFDADIIHYYAVYFLFGMACLRFTDTQLWVTIGALIAGFFVLVLVLDFDQGWQWETYTYTDFWTPQGFIRNLFFNGWHPVVPWLAFLLFGIFLARRPLSERRTQLWLVVVGSAAIVSAHIVSAWLTSALPSYDGETLTILYSVKPVPPMPLYMIAGMGAAALLIGLCLLLVGVLKNGFLLRVFTAPGHQTLTLYIAHIFVGMGTLEMLGFLADQYSGTMSMTHSVVAALLFIVAAVLYANIWAAFFKRGPVEWIMRKVAG